MVFLLVTLLITVSGVALLLYSISQLRRIAAILLESKNARIVRNVVLLFCLLLTTYLGFGFLFVFGFPLSNTSAVVSLLLLLTALYVTIFASISVLVRKVSEKKIEEITTINQRLTEMDHKKDEILAIMAHELKTPIASILGYADLLEKSKASSPAKKSARAISENARRLDGLVVDIGELTLLDLGTVRLDRERATLGSVVAALREECDVLARKKGIKTSYAASPPDFTFVTDQMRLNQVLANLWINALHSTESGGSIEVIAGRKDKEVHFSVKDTGAGIAEAHIPHIFERFYRVDTAIRRTVPGSGMGLAICKSLVERMGGRIWCESREGEGSAFHFTLPLAGQDASGV